MKCSLDDVLPLLRCPRTGSRLERRGELLQSPRGDCYPIVDGVADLRGAPQSPQSRARQVQAAYDGIGKPFYDFVIKSRAMMGFAYGSSTQRLIDLDAAVASFGDGVVLDVPVGTAVFTAEVYARHPGTRFLAIDYSAGMLRRARERARELGVENAVFVLADVGCLPFADEIADGALSLNGFHAFPEPARAAREIARCLKGDARLLATMCCTGERILSSLYIRFLEVPLGIFSAPHSLGDFADAFAAAGLDVERRKVEGAYALLEGRRRAATAARERVA